MHEANAREWIGRTAPEMDGRFTKEMKAAPHGETLMTLVREFMAAQSAETLLRKYRERPGYKFGAEGWEKKKATEAN